MGKTKHEWLRQEFNADMEERYGKEMTASELAECLGFYSPESLQLSNYRGNLPVKTLKARANLSVNRDDVIAYILDEFFEQQNEMKKGGDLLCKR